MPNTRSQGQGEDVRRVLLQARGPACSQNLLGHLGTTNPRAAPRVRTVEMCAIAARCLQDIGGDGAQTITTAPSPFVVFGVRASARCWFCAVFGYFSLYRSGFWDLFIAESVFIVPALLSSVLAIAVKGWLLLRRVKRRRADAASAVKERRNRKVMRAALHMLLQRFVLQQEERIHEELRNANDRQRYEGYGYMLGIAMEA